MSDYRHTLKRNRILAYGNWAFVIAGAYLLGGLGGAFLAVGIPGLMICLCNELVPAFRGEMSTSETCDLCDIRTKPPVCKVAGCPIDGAIVETNRLHDVIRRAHYACTKSSLTADERVFDATSILSAGLSTDSHGRT